MAVFRTQISDPCTARPDSTVAVGLLLRDSITLPAMSERSTTTGPDVSVIRSGPTIVEGSQPLVVSPTATLAVVPATVTRPSMRDPQIDTTEASAVVTGPVTSESWTMSRPPSSTLIEPLTVASMRHSPPAPAVTAPSCVPVIVCSQEGSMVTFRDQTYHGSTRPRSPAATTVVGPSTVKLPFSELT